MRVKNFLYIIVSGLTALLSFCFGVLLTNNMSKTDYAYLQSAIGYAGIPLLLLPLGMEYILPNVKKESVGAFFSNYTLVSILILIFSIFVLSILNLEPQVVNMTIAYVFSGITYTAFFEMYGKQLQLSLANFLALGFQVFVFYYLVTTNVIPTLAVIVAYLFGNLSRLSLHYMFLRRIGLKSFKIHQLEQFYIAFKHIGLPMIGVSLIGFTFGGFIRILLESGEILAELGVIFQVVSLFTFWYGLIDKIYRYDLIKDLSKVIFTRYLFFLVMPVFIFYVITSSVNLFSLIWGKNYSELDSLSGVISLFLLSISFKHVTNIISNSVGKSRVLFFVNILSAIVFIVLVFCNTPSVVYLVGSITFAYTLTFCLTIILNFDSLYFKRI